MKGLTASWRFTSSAGSIAGFFVVLGASFIVYLLVANAGDPLTPAYGITIRSQGQARIESLTAALNLDLNPVVRYFIWLKGVGGCFIGQCDFGLSVTTNQPVGDDLFGRILITLKLVLAASVLAVMIGVAIGIITALRQYSGFRLHDHLLHFPVLLPAGVLGRRAAQRTRRN